MVDRYELADVLTVLWKDVKVLVGSDRRLSALGYRLFWGALFATGLPLLMQDVWFASPEVLVIWAWLPIYVTSPMLGSAIAGERERHTLETLLATRLSDRAIVYGKIAAAALVGWIYALCSIFGGALVVSVVGGRGSATFYRPEILVGGVVCSLLGAWLGAAAGIGASIRAATQRQAQDNISLLTMGITIVVVVVRSVLEALGVPVVETLLGFSGWSLVSGFFVMLVLAGLGANKAALARFDRSALLLD